MLPIFLRLSPELASVDKWLCGHVHTSCLVTCRQIHRIQQKSEWVENGRTCRRRLFLLPPTNSFPRSLDARRRRPRSCCLVVDCVAATQLQPATEKRHCIFFARIALCALVKVCVLRRSTSGDVRCLRRSRHYEEEDDGRKSKLRLTISQSGGSISAHMHSAHINAAVQL